MELLAGLLTIDAITFVVTLLAGERIGRYVALGWKWYSRYRRVKFILSGGEQARLSALEKALKAAPLTAKQKAALTPEELAVLTDEEALLAK